MHVYPQQVRRILGVVHMQTIVLAFTCFEEFDGAVSVGFKNVI